MKMHPSVMVVSFVIYHNVVKRNISYLFSHYLILDDFDSSTAEYQQYDVSNPLRKRINKYHCQHPVIYIQLCVVMSIYKCYIVPYRCAMITREMSVMFNFMKNNRQIQKNKYYWLPLIN